MSKCAAYLVKRCQKQCTIRQGTTMKRWTTMRCPWTAGPSPLSPLWGQFGFGYCAAGRAVIEPLESWLYRKHSCRFPPLEPLGPLPYLPVNLDAVYFHHFHRIFQGSPSHLIMFDFASSILYFLNHSLIPIFFYHSFIFYHLPLSSIVVFHIFIYLYLPYFSDLWFWFLFIIFHSVLSSLFSQFLHLISFHHSFLHALYSFDGLSHHVEWFMYAHVSLSPNVRVVAQRQAAFDVNKRKTKKRFKELLCRVGSIFLKIFKRYQIILSSYFMEKGWKWMKRVHLNAAALAYSCGRRRPKALEFVEKTNTMSKTKLTVRSMLASESVWHIPWEHSRFHSNFEDCFSFSISGICKFRKEYPYCWYWMLILVSSWDMIACMVEINWIWWASQTQVEESHSETSKAHECSVVQEIQLVQFRAVPLQGASLQLQHTGFKHRFSGHQVYDVIWRISATATIGPTDTLQHTENACHGRVIPGSVQTFSRSPFARCLHLPQRGCSPNLECISASNMAALCEKGPANTQLLSRVTYSHFTSSECDGAFWCVFASFEATTFLLGERTSRAYGLYPSGWPGRVGRWSLRRYVHCTCASRCLVRLVRKGLCLPARWGSWRPKQRCQFT